jgi:carboxymethylenebutenolidase
MNDAVRLTDVAITTRQADASRGLRGVLGVPVGRGPWPGVVVLQEAWGVDDVMRRHVQRLAGFGYLALLPDLYSEGGAVRCLVSTFRALRAGHGRAFADIESARQTLLRRADCSGRLGVIGFCMGGGFALLSASRGFDVASPNYGRVPRDVDAALVGACPIVASYGGRDAPFRGAAQRLGSALTRLGIEHDVVEYAAAGHSFLNDAPAGPAALQPFLRVSAIGPEPAAAAHAWRRIEAFFARHLQ